MSTHGWAGSGQSGVEKELIDYNDYIVEEILAKSLMETKGEVG